MTGSGRLEIPAVFVGRTDGDMLRDAIADGLTVSMRAGGDGSLRWLIGEDSSSFGGAIRDMWNPEGLTDPGRVFSERYYCGSGDNGGVHINSGIPNFAFYRVAVRLGGNAWERAGLIWYRALTSSELSSNASFQDLVDLTAKLAEQQFGAGSDEHQAVIGGWADAGLFVTSAPDEPDAPDVPDVPDQPDAPDAPDEPDVPDQPDEPDQPGDPG